MSHQLDCVQYCINYTVVLHHLQPAVEVVDSAAAETNSER